LETQNLTTSDHKTVCARAQVILKIVNPILALVETSSVEEVVADMALNGVKSVISKTTLDDLIDKSRSVDTAISKKIRDDLAPYGVEVIRAFLSDFAPARVICLVKD
jgi:regulator of protease activity HflC (stomatin/prohibitin superfamily)